MLLRNAMQAASLTMLSSSRHLGMPSSSFPFSLRGFSATVKAMEAASSKTSGSRLGAIKSGEQKIWAAQNGVAAPGALEGQAIAGSVPKVLEANVKIML